MKEWMNRRMEENEYVARRLLEAAGCLVVTCRCGLHYATSYDGIDLWSNGEGECQCGWIF